MRRDENIVDVTVIIPAYNSEKVIARAIDSVLAQTAQPKHIIVIDDGSTDKTESVVSDYDNVQYIKQKNSGPSAARNHGIKLATTEWIAFLDSDDLWFPDKLQCQCEILTNNKNLMWCSGLMLVNKGGVKSEFHVAKNVLDTVQRYGAINVFDLTIYGCHLHINNLIINRKVFDRVGVFDESVALGEDRDLWWRISLAFPEIGLCLKSCSEYFVDTPNSALKQTVDRTPSLSVILKNYSRYTETSNNVDERFISYLRNLGISYLLREASGIIIIENNVLLDFKSIIKLGPYYSVILWILKKLPKGVSSKIVSRLEPRVV